MDDYVELGCLNVEDFSKWLQNAGVDEETVQKMKESNIDGHIFDTLTDDDFKDLFDTFIVRKKLRDIRTKQRQLTELKEEASVPPPKKPRLCDASPPPPPKNPKFSSEIISPSRGRESPFLRGLNTSNTTSSSQGNVTHVDVKQVPVPTCGILANWREYPAKIVDNARVKIIRQCMDSLIALCGDRPTEYEIITLSKALVEQYSVLRDEPNQPARGNYRNVKKFLERRMYNITPPRSNRGRKSTATRRSAPEDEPPQRPNGERPKGSNGEDAHNGSNGELEPPNGEDVPLNNFDEEVVSQNGLNMAANSGVEPLSSDPDAELVNDAAPTNGSNTNAAPASGCNPEADLFPKESIPEAVNPEVEIPSDEESQKPDRVVEALDKELRKCGAQTMPQNVKQLIKLTKTHRNKLALEITPKSSRVEVMLDTYPVFKKTEMLIANMIMEIEEVTEDQLISNLLTATNEILDYVYGKHLSRIPRGALKTKDQQVMVAMANLPIVCNARSGKASAPKVAPIVHIVKTDETWQEVAATHKGMASPWLMYQRFGNKEIITLMIKNTTVTKAKSAVEAVLGLMGIYYVAMLEYPSSAHGALLYLQDKVLCDKIHNSDLPILKKATAELKKYQETAADVFG